VPNAGGQHHNKIVYIQSKLNNLVFELKGRNKRDLFFDCSITQENYKGGPAQRWKLSDVGGGKFKIESMLHPGFVIEKRHDNSLGIANFNGAENQKWCYRENSLFCENAVVDIPAQSHQTGTAVITWHQHHGKLNQQFQLFHSYKLVANSGRVPPRALKHGVQNNDGQVRYPIVAHTQWGDIPGKATQWDMYYSYGGREHSGGQFSWVVSAGTTSLVSARSKFHGPVPCGAIKCGNQIDQSGRLFAAIANTQWGKIPGKANKNTCWFPYAGQEHSTPDFDFICSK
jgi:hypothetical protein